MELQDKSKEGENVNSDLSKIKTRKDLEKRFKLHGVRVIGQSDAHLMLEAAKYGEIPILEYFMSDPSQTEPKNSIGETLAHIAARNNQVRVLDFLIKKKQSLANKNGLGETPLMQAAEEGHLETVRFLCQFEGADSKETNRFGETCLHYAAREGRINVCEYLLKRAPALSKIETKLGRIPLFYALENNHREVIKLLDEIEKAQAKKLTT